jgi:hypothetical protein
MVFGLLFSMFVSLLLIPSIYILLQPRKVRAAPGTADAAAQPAAPQGR